MTPQPLPTNLHPSQCYRLLDPERDTLQAGDKVLFRLGHDGWKWESIHESRHGQVLCKNHVYRRPFTPPQPVQVQECWRLLECGKDTIQDGDGHQPEHNKWEPFPSLWFGKPYHNALNTARRRVTVPVAAPVAVADAAQPLTTFADQEASKIMKAFDGEPNCEPSRDYAAYRERLFHHFMNNHGFGLKMSEMDEIEHIVLGYFRGKAFQHKTHEPTQAPPESGPYLASMDGTEAPNVEHATIEKARVEAERMATQYPKNKVRLLRQLGTVKSEMIVKWSDQ